MSRRIDVELTSALGDGTWTWRAAGAREPKGVLDGAILPNGAAVGDELKIEIEQMLDGIEVLGVVKGRDKAERTDLLELLPAEQPFEAVIETRAKRDRRDGGRQGDGRGSRRDRDDRPRRPRDDNRRDRSSDGKPGDERRRRDGSSAERGRARPSFTPPPELPQRPKPKRLRPGKARRNEVLAAIPEEQRPVAELALQGMSAVRARVKEENARLAAAGQPLMPEASVLKMAEDVLPKLRVADWLDRAEAAQRQMEHLDLRDLRSVVAASDDPIVARDESTRALAAELKVSLTHRQDEELRLWLGDIDAALGVGRVIRALRLSSQPPKAGVMFPPDLARRLGEAATQGLLPSDPPDRWSAVMEAAAFSPVRGLVNPTEAPPVVSDDLKATALRLGPLLPHVATLLGIEVPVGAPIPKPLRHGPSRKANAGQSRPPRAKKKSAPPATTATGDDQPAKARPRPTDTTAKKVDAAAADPPHPPAPAGPPAAEPPVAERAAPGDSGERASASPTDTTQPAGAADVDATTESDELTPPESDQPPTPGAADATDPPPADTQPEADHQVAAQPDADPHVAAQPEADEVSGGPVAAEAASDPAVDNTVAATDDPADVEV
jgi:hypothetical protein